MIVLKILASGHRNYVHGMQTSQSRNEMSFVVRLVSLE